MSEIPLPLNTPGNFRKKIEEIMRITSSQGRFIMQDAETTEEKKM